ncbi:MULTISPECIES: acyl carrier protein [Streptomyces]|uniref:acyl carrier protein n=1 Tax=Streptomyces TaxID=1883 RepID=UPI00338EFFE3
MSAPHDPQTSAPASDTPSQALTHICATVIGAPDLQADSDLFTHGLTSLNLVRLVGAIQERWGIRLTGPDVHDHPTAQQLAHLVESRLNGHTRE